MEEMENSKTSQEKQRRILEINYLPKTNTAGIL